MVHDSFYSSIYNSQDMKATKVSINRWMDKEDVAHIHNEILLSHKKKQKWVICSEVDGPRVCHTEWSKSEREKQIPYANTYIWNLRKKKKRVMFLYTLALTLKIVATAFYLRIGLCACYSSLLPRTSHHRISFCQSRALTNLPQCAEQKVCKNDH